MATYLSIRYPLFWEELRRRMRGGHMQVVLLIYTLLLIALLFFATQERDIGSDPREWPQFGKTLWQIFLMAQMGIIIILSPGLTAGAISSEKEQGTLDLLLLTRMSSLSIVLGKFFGAIGQMMLLLLVGLPIISVVFFFGGVSPGEIVLGYALTISAGLGYASLGFFTSCKCKRIVPAVAWGYAAMLLLAVVLPGVTGLLMQMANTLEDIDKYLALIIMASDPLVTYVTIFVRENFTDGVSSTWAAAQLLWPTIVTMLAITALMLAESTMMVERMRGLSIRFMPRSLKRPVSSLILIMILYITLIFTLIFTRFK